MKKHSLKQEVFLPSISSITATYFNEKGEKVKKIHTELPEPGIKIFKNLNPCK